ncbi:MAG: phage holin family protein [Solirubrobacteraceae bacterium]
MAEQATNGSVLSERSVADLLKQLSDQTTRLARQELELAKVELITKGKRTGIGAGLLGTAGVLGLGALGALIATAILALSLVVAGWLAALIIAGVCGGLAGIMALAGKVSLAKGGPPVPEQTLLTVRQDVEVAQERAKAGRR